MQFIGKKNTNKQGKIFGGSLSTSEEAEWILKCIQVCSKHTKFNGVYRVSPAHTVIEDYKKQLDADPASVDLNQLEAKVVTVLLKQFFSNLSEPIISFELYESLVAVVEKDEDDIETIRAILHMLPDRKLMILGTLMNHLHDVCDAEVHSCMGPGNLAICFGPALMRHENSTIEDLLMDVENINTLIGTMIVHSHQIFDWKMAAISKKEEQDVIGETNDIFDRYIREKANTDWNSKKEIKQRKKNIKNTNTEWDLKISQANETKKAPLPGKKTLKRENKERKKNRKEINQAWMIDMEGCGEGSYMPRLFSKSEREALLKQTRAFYRKNPRRTIVSAKLKDAQKIRVEEFDQIATSISSGNYTYAHLDVWLKELELSDSEIDRWRKRREKWDEQLKSEKERGFSDILSDFPLPSFRGTQIKIKPVDFPFHLKKKFGMESSGELENELGDESNDTTIPNSPLPNDTGGFGGSLVSRSPFMSNQSSSPGGCQSPPMSPKTGHKLKKSKTSPLGGSKTGKKKKPFAKSKLATGGLGISSPSVFKHSSDKDEPSTSPLSSSVGGSGSGGSGTFLGFSPLDFKSSSKKEDSTPISSPSGFKHIPKEGVLASMSVIVVPSSPKHTPPPSSGSYVSNSPFMAKNNNSSSSGTFVSNSPFMANNNNDTTPSMGSGVSNSPFMKNNNNHSKFSPPIKEARSATHRVFTQITPTTTHLSCQATKTPQETSTAQGQEPPQEGLLTEK
eukprot:CAMPEP_0174272114 /NCGR_PEP_ID=MMETSP0439-20130205/50182_1 /TAXON_ID=0 /ORGANISM="Stereomyxa ramosa, Strain Chinc5" /LENGTH=734 /DNA_ID=CAMNT_0015362509 /DNA_START=70 /DNA_END=2275 /DNA_ORIENTATION=+